jgi:DNA-binding NtrC family response regulator
MKIELPTITHTVLIVEDQSSMIKFYKKALEKEPLKLVYVKTANEALEFLTQETPATILLDLGLPDMNGKEVLQHVKQQQLNSTVIVVTWQDSVDSVVEMMRAGAFDYLEKPVAVERLQVTLRNAVRQYELQRYIDSNLMNLHRENYHGMMGASPPMQVVYRMIDNVANSQVDVLITGENGSGKELCARVLHQESNRANRPFISVNCTAVPESLIEAHLFGHIKGDFSSGINYREGAVLQAHGGTLFLDEIDRLELSFQNVLLRFIQTKTYQKVGSNKQEQVDVRVVCATSRDLATEINLGRFREDLYYRLNVIHIKMPSLRSRGEDILLLARTFLQQFCEKEGKPLQEFTPEAKQLLLQHPWPGNVRQLQNVIHNIIQLNQSDQITAQMLITRLEESTNKEDLCSSKTATTDLTVPLSISIATNGTLRTFDEIEKDVILATIEYYRGDIAAAANSLGIGVTTIYRKLREWNIATKRIFCRTS